MGCGSYINIYNYFFFFDLLKIMRFVDCNIIYLLNIKGRSIVLLCKVELGEYGICNKIGLWEMLDFEIKWGCENLIYGFFFIWRFCYVFN